MKSQLLILVGSASLVACGPNPNEGSDREDPIPELDSATESDSSDPDPDDEDDHAPGIPDAGGQTDDSDGPVGDEHQTELRRRDEPLEDAAFEHRVPRRRSTTSAPDPSDPPVGQPQLTEFGWFVACGRDGDYDGNTRETVADCVMSSGASCADTGGSWACFRHSWSKKVYCECDTGG